MKTLSTLQYSGYPLMVVKTSPSFNQKGVKLLALKFEAKQVHRKENDLANNPVNWDESWFGNYE